MIYITQLIFVKAGKEEAFLEFESHALPLMAEHGGTLLYRLRPDEHSFVHATGELPYEIHVIAFESQEALDRFLQDDRRQAFLPLKESSISSTLLVKGQRM
ncbi:MAG: DUF1330 domain-containing protein [Bacteroidota bacterium]